MKGKKHIVKKLTYLFLHLRSVTSCQLVMCPSELKVTNFKNFEISISKKIMFLHNWKSFSINLVTGAFLFRTSIILFIPVFFLNPLRNIRPEIFLSDTGFYTFLMVANLQNHSFIRVGPFFTFFLLELRMPGLLYVLQKVRYISMTIKIFLKHATMIYVLK